MDSTEELQNKNPQFLVDLYHTITGFLGEYGWVLLITSLILFFILRRVFGILMGIYIRNRDARAAAEYHKDSDKYEERIIAMEIARQKMQEKLNRDAEEYLKKQKMREEKKRAEWLERHGANVKDGIKLGNGSKKPEESTKTLKKEYNPLSGDASGPSYRAPKRSGCGGGCG